MDPPRGANDARTSSSKSPADPETETDPEAATDRDTTKRDSPNGRAKIPDASTASQMTSSEPEEQDEISPAVLDKSFPAYLEIEREIARGGLGRIVRARDQRLFRIVALKQVYRHSDSAAARFAREVKITARLQHPNIIPVYEAGRGATGNDYYSMRLVDGETLSQLIRKSESLEERIQLLPRIVDVANAVSYAHSQGVIHRDLKPANVLVGPFGETVVIDWGLAKELGEPETTETRTDDTEPDPPRQRKKADPRGHHTVEGSVLGTPAYMPPEQAVGHDVDSRADVYSLGAMLYQLIAGHPPYTDESENINAARVLAGPPTPLSKLVPDAPRDLLAVVERAMARDPDRRYLSADELVTELLRFTSGRLVSAYRYSLAERLQRFGDRNRAAVSTGLLALLALMVFGVFSLLRIADERDQASQSARAERAARKDAEQRVSELIVEKARFLLDDDPTLAVAWLKHLKSPSFGAASVAAQAEDRGIAWRILRGHKDQIRSVALSPGGKRAFSGGDDGLVNAWELNTGQSRVLFSHSERVTSVGVSDDGRKVVASSYDGTVSISNPETRVSTTLRGADGPLKYASLAHSGQVAAISESAIHVWSKAGKLLARVRVPVDREARVQFSSDGKRLLSWSHEGKAILWDLGPLGSSAEPVETLPHVSLVASAGHVQVARLSQDAKHVFLGSSEGRLLEVDVAHNGFTEVARQASAITEISLSQDGTKLVTGGMDGSIFLYDLSTGTHKSLLSHTERVEGLSFSPDGSLVASTGWDKQAIVRDLRTGSTKTLRGHGDVVVGLAFSADTKTLVTGSWDKTLRVWRLSRDGERTFAGHRVGAHAVDFSPDGELLASGGHDNMVRLTNVHTGAARVLEGHQDHVYRVLFSPDGRLLASSSDDQTVRLWKVADASVRVLEGHTADVEEIAFSHDGRLLASAAEDKTARLWSIPEGQLQRTLEHDADVSAVAFSRDDERLVTGSRNGTLYIWAPNQSTPLRVLAHHRGRIGAIVASPHDETFAATSYDGEVSVWSYDGERRLSLTDLPGASVARFSPDGRKLAVAGVAPKLWLCELSSKQCTSLPGHRGKVWDLEFTSDGALLISASGDHTARIWDVQTLEHRNLDGHRAPIFDLDLSPDEKTLATASADTTLRIWPVRGPPKPSEVSRLLERITRVTVTGQTLDSNRLQHGQL